MNIYFCQIMHLCTDFYLLLLFQKFQNSNKVKGIWLSVTKIDFVTRMADTIRQL